MATTKKWRESETVKFVELYEQMECLWNFRHDNYKDKSERDASMQKIIAEMNIKGFGQAELKSKIKNIRSTYCQEIQKIKRSNEEYQSSLKWFPIAHRFLDKVIISAKNIPNSDCQLEPKEEDRNMSQTGDENECKNIRIFKRPRKEKKIDTLQRIDPSSDKLSELRSSVDAKLEDEFTHFGNNVAFQLRDLPLREALICQTRIMEILTEHRIEALENRSVNSRVFNPTKLVYCDMSPSLSPKHEQLE